MDPIFMNYLSIYQYTIGISIQPCPRNGPKGKNVERNKVLGKG